MNDLGGRKVGLLEARRGSELAELVRRNGGEPLTAPAVREAAVDASTDVRDLVDHLRSERSPLLVVQTGAAVSELAQQARALGLEAPLKEGFRQATVVCRGPKPLAALRKEALECKETLSVRAPFTTTEVLETLATESLDGRYVAILHYGERNAPLTQVMQQAHARVRDCVLYEWQLPEDLGPLAAMVESLIAGDVAVLAVTSQVQIRHLVQVAEQAGRRDALLDALRSRVTVAAIGPTCAQALVDLGVVPAVVPSPPKMGTLVSALVSYFSSGGPKT